MTTTINGLHSCKPGNEPKVGQVKTFVIENRTGKNNKTYIKIRSANVENGGTPHRILSAEPTGYTDKYNNVSFNLEIEEAVGAFQQARSAMAEDDHAPPFKPDSEDRSEYRENAPQSPTARSNGGDGVMETKKHLMRSANLLVLCIRAADKAIAPNVPPIAQTTEFFLATVGKLYIEASGRRSNDNVNWWSYIDKMPDTPIKEAKFQKVICTCENTDGDNPLCPVHSDV